MNPLTQSKDTIILPVLIALMLVCFGLSQTAQAVCQAGCDFITIRNTFLGEDALINNINGINNTATGAFALRYNTAGINNTATGAYALQYNTTGINNTGFGFDALLSNTSGGNNTGVGLEALWANTTGINNTAIGASALSGNTVGRNNIALGVRAGANLTTGGHNIDIGNYGRDGESDTIRIGRGGIQNHAFIAGISGATVAEGVGVVVDTDGHLGTVVSSERFKSEIKPMDKGSEAILALKPVTFHYKKELDPKGIPQFGLVAEQVEKVNPDLVARDDQGRPYTVRYEAVNAMLLNEFLKEHRKREQQDRKIEELEAIVSQLQSALHAQAAQIQKVSAQLAEEKAFRRLVVNE